MKIEDQVVSLKLAKELKELGVKQDSLWFWTWAEWNEEVEWVLIPQDRIAKLKKEHFSAFTVAELGEMLPRVSYSMNLAAMNKKPHWFCDVHLLYSRTYAQTEADARAKMLIYLIKEGIIKGKNTK